MSDVLQQVQDAVEEYDLFAPGDRLVVGLSGGPDSLCLLHVLTRLREAYDVQLHVAHLNHGARGDASDADAAFVRKTAVDWNLPVTVEKRDVPQLADEHGLAFEEAARRVRYAFLARVARRIGAANVAVGHNADDQAETVLMHIIRGSGLSGLRGMLPYTPLTDYRLLAPFRDEREDDTVLPVEGGEQRTTLGIIRPLLKVTRDDIEKYCASHGLQPRFDRSNLDTTHFRNRLRHELIPELQTYNPGIRERLCHMADIAAADYEVLVDARKEAWQHVVRHQGDKTIVFDQSAWQELPVALQRALLRQAAFRLRANLRDVTFVHIENARKVALEGETGKASTLPAGLELRVGYETLTIGDAGDPGPAPDEPLLCTEGPLEVPVPGSTPLPESDWVLKVSLLDRWTMADVTTSDHPWTAYFDAGALSKPIRLRTRREGDAFQPLGMEGHHVQLSDLMINTKIPEAWRGHVPLLVADGEILWVCGRRVAEGAKVESDTERVARFRFEQAA